MWFNPRMCLELDRHLPLGLLNSRAHPARKCSCLRVGRSNLQRIVSLLRQISMFAMAFLILAMFLQTQHMGIEPKGTDLLLTEIGNVNRLNRR